MTISTLFIQVVGFKVQNLFLDFYCYHKLTFVPRKPVLQVLYFITHFELSPTLADILNSCLSVLKVCVCVVCVYRHVGTESVVCVLLQHFKIRAQIRWHEIFVEDALLIQYITATK